MAAGLLLAGDGQLTASCAGEQRQQGWGIGDLGQSTGSDRDCLEAGAKQKGETILGNTGCTGRVLCQCQHHA